MSPPPPPPPSALRPGVKLEGGRYSLLRPLGGGGNGVVWLAQQESLATDVVVKFPKRWSGASATEAEFFIEEMRRLASLSSLHPHIVNILDAGAHRGRPFFVMQHLSRGALDAYCDTVRTGPNAPPMQTADPAWIQEIAAALDFLHQRGTVHRDVKPGNILLDESHGAYLADFGIAIPHAVASRNQPAELRSRETITGSLPYLAPELLLGGPASPASDQFALAVTIFEFVTGRRPFDGETAYEILENYNRRMTGWLTVPPTRTNTSLWKTLRRAFGEHPADRYLSCTDLAYAIAQSLGNTVPPIPRPPAFLPALPSGLTASTKAMSTQAKAVSPTVPTPPEKSPDCHSSRILTLDRLLHERRVEKNGP